MYILKIVSIICLLSVIHFVPVKAVAGSLDSSGAPSAGSNMPSLTDIYNQLDTGATSTPAGSFQEPSAGPTAGTGKSLSEIKAKLPSPDNTNGATANDVKSGKTFWGLRTDGTWGPQTGSNANLADTGSGDATSSDIKNGKKAWVDGAEVTGILYGGYTCAGTMNGTRWCDNGNGTIRDMTTGLIWLKDAGCAGTKTWDNADIWSQGLASGTCGLSDGSVAGDWRVPTKKELSDLSNGTEYVRSGTPRNFINVQSYFYWSSSTYAYITYRAWKVDMWNGGVDYVSKDMTGYVFPVRAGQ